MPKRTVSDEAYFTHPDIAARCITVLNDVYPLENFDLIIEPSAGDGAFYLLLPESTRTGIDINPRIPDLVHADYLTWNPPSVSSGKGRILTVGNPPFGARASIACKFIKHAATYSDVIAFILPQSFNKYTFQNRVPEQFHLISSTPVTSSYAKNGNTNTLVSVATVFQIWERRTTPRDIATQATTHPDFVMRHAHLSRVTPQTRTELDTYDFAIPQVGADFTPRDTEPLTKGSHWFIKANTNQKPASVRKTFSRMNFGFLTNMNTAHTSLSRADIIRAYETVKNTTVR